MMKGVSGVATDVAPPAIAPAIAPDMLVADRYRLEARLGSGGGGTVWRSFDQKLGALVALKILTPEGDLERWRREVAMARRIADRHVCRVHDLGETGQLRFVTMELVEGEGLRAHMTPELSAVTARELFRQIVHGVAAIHAAGVVHRDIKPENIVVGDGRAVIVDFGLAREPKDARTTTIPNATPAATTIENIGAMTVDRRGPRARRSPTTGRAPLEPARVHRSPTAPEDGPTPVAAARTVTNAGTIVGTPRYMSPEQAAGELVDARTDIWALGLIGHELMCGTFPVVSNDGRKIDPAVDKTWRGIAPILKRCLARDPEARFADARELAAALARTERRRGRIVRIAVGSIVVAGAAIAFANPLATSSDPRLPSVARTSIPTTIRTTIPATIRTTIPTTIPSSVAPDIDRASAEVASWPDAMPASAAIDRDAKRFAYTTVAPKLAVRSLESGHEEVWELPVPPRAGDRLVMPWANGWFSDGSIAIVATTADGGYALHRVYRDGRSKLLHAQDRRFAIAISPDDRIALGESGDAVWLLPRTTDEERTLLVQLGRGEQLLAIAWSPDGAHLALARAPATASAPAKLQLVSRTGDATRDLWSGGTLATVDMMLGWLDDSRVVFTQQEPETRVTSVVTVDIGTGIVQQRASFANEYIGVGSAAAGVAIALRGTANYSVQVGDAKATRLVPLNDVGVHGSRLAGWTSDGRVVFSAGPLGSTRVVRAKPGSPCEPWPGTQPGVEVPHTMSGDRVVVHRVDASAPRDRRIVIEVLDLDGTRRELARLSSESAMGTPIRCAGDRAPPCVLQEISGTTATWTEIDPDTRARGPVIHQRSIGERYHRDAALSIDGNVLAISEGTSQLVVVDRRAGTTRTFDTSRDAALQSLGFAPDGSIWATSIGFRGRLFGLFVFERARGHAVEYAAPRPRGSSDRDALRWFWRPSPSRDGKQIAVTVREFHFHVARFRGL